MRGDILGYTMAVDNSSTVTTPTDTSGQSSDYSVIQNNASMAITPGSVYWALLLLGLYALWGWWDSKKSMASDLAPGEIVANISNFFKITLVVVIGINLMNVFLTKLAAMKIPLVSRIAGTYLPLFSL